MSGQTVWVISDQGGELGHTIQSIAVFSDGIHAVTDADACAVSVIDVRTSNEVTRFKYHGDSMIQAVAVSPDCLTIVSGSRDNTTTVVAFSERGWELVKRLKHHNDVRVIWERRHTYTHTNTNVPPYTHTHTHAHTHTHDSLTNQAQTPHSILSHASLTRFSLLSLAFYPLKGTPMCSDFT